MSEEDDGVGYCKPPKQHRFKRGHSGNKRGRPKGRGDKRTFSKKLSHLLAQPTQARFDGKLRRLPYFDVFVTSLVKRSIDNPAASSVLHRLMKTTGLSTPPPDAPDMKVGVMVVAPAMSTEEWLQYWSNVPFPTDPIAGLQGLDGEAMEKARKEKRELQEHGYDDSSEEEGAT